MQATYILSIMSDRQKSTTQSEPKKDDLKPFSTSLPASVIEKIKTDAESQPFDVTPAAIAREIILAHYEKE